MRKSHGPDLRKAVIDLAKCPACRGRGVMKGVFHDLDCIQCNASGWVRADTFGALPLEDLVTQLNFKLQAAEQRLVEAQRARQVTGPAATYEQNNRRGAGGTNFTGD